MDNQTAINLLEKLKDDRYELYMLGSVMDEAMDLAIRTLKSIGWVPVSERLPNETGYYRCSVEWYGTSTKKLLIQNGHEIENRVIDIHFLKSEKIYLKVLMAIVRIK